ncbi:MAG: hemerythrin domain-containing protein [Methylotenera sp.]|nr:hemerythrin domain-containing protein [Methylotenera sp.]
MGFFSRLFGWDNKQEVPVQTTKTEEGIPYDAGLVSKLKADHQELLAMFGKISQAAGAGQFDAVPKMLKRFKLDLQTHLVTENVRFYVYVQQRQAGDSGASSLIADLRKEMNGIASAAVHFIGQYENAIFTEDVANQFRKDLAGIGEVLVQRINTEESSLYTLYMPK